MTLSLDTTTQKVIDQFLNARLMSAHTAVSAANELADPELIAVASENFLFVSGLVRRWQALQISHEASSTHQGRALLQSLTESKRFEFGREQRLPLIRGDESKQIILLNNFWREMPAQAVVRIQIRRRHDRLIMRFSNWELPAKFAQVFSRRDPTGWLFKQLSVERLEAWLWMHELTQAEIIPYVFPRQPEKFYLTFQIIQQLALPLS